MILNFAVALGIGLLIGVERERRKGEGPSRSFAGIRTFTVASLAGATSSMVGGEVLLATVTAGIAVLATAAYWSGRGNDPGLTTAVALVLTVVLGGLSMQRPALAGGLAVTVAALLVARAPLHRFVRSVLTEDELHDALILAGATLVVLPLVPDRPIGPYGSLNPHSIWILVILIMTIGAAGYIAVRSVGARFGLPIAGLASGFISSTATIGAMGALAARTKALLPAAVAGAVLSTVATIVEMTIVIAATSLPTMRTLSIPLVCAGVAAFVYGTTFTIWAIQQQQTDDQQPGGRAFSLRTALAFAMTLASILIASAALRDWLGKSGVVLVTALAGFVDAHAAAISVASLVAGGKLHVADATVPILAGLSTNTISKVFFAASSGERRFAFRVIPGLIVVALAAWAGALHVLTCCKN
jgi:uncharacterized membrane protein (DUF4010 family)